MENQKLRKADLAQFTGTEQWYRHPIARDILYTDGIQYLANTGGAYWLIDKVAFLQTHPRFKKQEFQVWTLKVDLEKSEAVLTCDDGNYNVIFTEKILYTDFPLDEIKIYFTGNVILLPSEY
ncbi:MAG: hypothetical protein DI529_05335 [Chryseobacterium sp.]|nr:MAG: hypothetical protein DI529_05335 [Chryseobacterium sp.]